MRLRVFLATSFLAALALPLLAQSPYQRWLDEEVRWIISDDERSAFNRLPSDDERMAFIENFWQRRDPTPGTPANELREEHYRRIAWANDRFGSQIPGWQTDRGRMYIQYGAPDEREEHPAGDVIPGAYERWLYRSLEGIGRNVILEFVDESGRNDYRLALDPAVRR